MEGFTLNLDYLPARLVEGKPATKRRPATDWFISFSVRDARTSMMRRYRIKMNRVASVADRRKLGRKKAAEINARLALGWNPLTEAVAPRAHYRLDEVLKVFLETKRREKLEANSIRSYTSSVRILSLWMSANGMATSPVSAFTSMHAREFITQSYVDRELGARAFNNYHTFFTTLWRWMKEMGYAPANVFEGIKKKRIYSEDKTKRPPTIEERATIRKHLEYYNARMFAFCLLVFHSGIRPKEAFMLKPEHFHLKELYIDIPRTISKVKRPRHAAIARVDLPHMRALAVHLQAPEHYVFSTGFNPGPRLKDSRYSAAQWAILRRHTGLPMEVSLYQLKHGGGQQLSEDGMKPNELMNHYGHADLKMTTVYTRSALKGGSAFVRNKATAF